MTWPVVPLGEVADTALGKMLDRGKSLGNPHVPYLRNVNIQWRRIDTSDILTMELAATERERFGVKSGDVLVCEGGEIGRAAVWPGRDEYLAYQKALHRVRPHKSLDRNFLVYLLEHYARSGILARLSTGSTIAHLPQQKLRQVPIMQPPLGVQQRIVDFLDVNFGELDAADAHLETAKLRIERWVEQCLTRFLWSSPARTVRIRDVLREPMRNGRSDRAAAGTASGTRTLTLTAVTRNEFADRYTKLTATSLADADGLWLEPGDIFVQRSNTPELVGTAARFEGPTDWAIFPDLLIRLRADEDQIDSRFLVAALRSRPVRASLKSRAKGLAGSMPKIDQATVGSVEIPFPSRSEQEYAIAYLADVTAAAQRMAAEVDSACKRSRILRRSLLAAAFSGRLANSCDSASG